MTQHTPLVNAYERMVKLQENNLYMAARDNGNRALKHEADAHAWKNAGDLLIDEASEDEQLIMQAIYRESQVLALEDQVREMRQPVKSSRHHKCFICGEPADLQLEDGQWECDNCSDIAADFSMEQERENND